MSLYHVDIQRVFHLTNLSADDRHVHIQLRRRLSKRASSHHFAEPVLED